MKTISIGSLAVIALLIAVILGVKSCVEASDLHLSNISLNKEISQSTALANKYLSQNKILTSKIDSLEKAKAAVKEKVVAVEKKTETEVKKASVFTSKEVADYYSKRYGSDFVSTKSGIIFSDTIKKLNITELIQKDGCFAERWLLKKQISIEEAKGFKKDTIIKNYFAADFEKQKAIDKQNSLIKNQEELLKSEKTKKTFWQIATGSAIGIAGYLLIRG